MATAKAPARYAVIDCEDDARWRGLAPCIVALFGRDDERWDHYRAYDDELPDVHALDGEYAGVVITGSSHSATMKGSRWVDALRSWARDALTARECGGEGRCKIIAMGFGSYICAQALGGEVGLNPRGEHVVGGTTLETTPSFRALTCFTSAIAAYGAPQGDAKGEKLSVHQNRAHTVTKLPDCGEVAASSASSAVEIWTTKNGELLAWQHSFSDGVASVLSHKVESGLDTKRSTSSKPKRVDSKVKDDLPDNDAGFLIGVARCFLRGGSAGAHEDETYLKERRRNARECLSWAAKRREEILTQRALARSGVSAAANNAKSMPDAEAEAERAFNKIAEALNAEINLVTSEVRFLEHANDTASVVYGEIGQKIEALDVFVAALRQKESALEPKLTSIAKIEHQINDLEHTVRVIDKHVTALETRFKALRRG
jgi:GMP synthase-like glutamine amidotransferase